VSKLSGASQRLKAVLIAGHSLSRIENHAVSRLRPLWTLAWRQTPSNVKPEPDCCCPRSGIERIALPGVAAVTQFIKGAPHHQVHRLGCGNPTLKWRCVNDPANLDATSCRVNIQVTRLAERPAASEIDHRVFWAYTARPDGIDLGAQFLGAGIGSPRQVRPEAAFAIRPRITLRRAGYYRLVRLGRIVHSSAQAAAVSGVTSLARVSLVGGC